MLSFWLIVKFSYPRIGYRDHFGFVFKHSFTERSIMQKYRYIKISKPAQSKSYQGFVLYLGLGFPNSMNTTTGLPVCHKTIRYHAN